MSDTPKAIPTEKKIARIVAWTAGSVGLLLLLIFCGLAYYSTTADFQRRIGKTVEGALEDATGGKVEIGHIALDVWHLSVEVDGLVIHGLEAPTEAPYLAADKILIRIKILSFLAHTAGSGAASHIGLNLLRVEQPRIHLIVDKDGKTNQPTPKKKTQSNEPVIDTLLDLKARQVELVNGVALLNDRAIPFNLAAQDLNAQVHYIATSDRYGATIDLNDLRTQIAKQPEARSSLHLEAEIGRDAADLKAFDFRTGDRSELKASAGIQQFKNPQWHANLAGSLELRQLTVLANVPGFNTGSVDLNLAGHNCYIAPAVAQKQPRLWERLRSKKEAAGSAPKTLPPDPDCQAGYLLLGSFKVHSASYRTDSVRLHDINGGAQLRVTPSELLFTALSANLPGGGSILGELKIDDWLGEAPANAAASSPTVKGATATANKTATAITGRPAVPPAPTAAPVSAAHAYLTVKVDVIPLRTILDVTAPKDLGDLGFDTAVTGPVKVEWGGPVVDVSQTVVLDADLQLTPTGVHRATALSDVPVTGQILGRYEGKTQTIDVQRLLFNTQQSTLTASGVLGVAQGDPLTSLNVDLNLRDLSEYNQLLVTLNLTGNGRKGAAAIPVNLHGTAQFHGTARGEIAKLDVKGHLQADNLDVRLGDIANPPPTPANPHPAPTSNVTDIHIDNLIADAEYTPMGLAVASSTFTQGSAVLHVAGSFKPRAVAVKKSLDYQWDDGTALDTRIQLANAKVVDLLTIAGQQNKIPLTGNIALDGRLTGTFGNLNGSGTIALQNGVAYGEPYESANVTLAAQGQDFEASQVALKLHGMSIDGNGGYDLKSKHLHGHIQGDNLQLSKFKTVQNANMGADGVVSLVADANGTVEQPGLKASVKIANVVADIDGQPKPIGDATVDAHSEGSRVFYNLKSTLIGTQVAGNGHTDLTGDYQTQATLTVTAFDVARAMAIFAPGGVTAKSNISGTATVSGPAKTPTALTGRAQFSDFEIASQGITLKAAEPLTIGLRNGLATIDQVHITGQDTDLHVGGTAQLFGAVNPKTKKPDSGSGKLAVQANGSISMALAHTFDPDLITSGKVVFAVDAGGVFANPALTGKVEFQNVNLAIEGIPNGLSNMNGTLVFNEDRLNVQSLVATTGGGQLKIGGFLSYRNGLYADLTATGDVVRVRLYGLSATANANFRLQGGRQGAQLTGNVLLTRFGIGADVDFAAFASAGGVSAPPDPSSPSNKIRMDIHVTSSPQLDFQNSYAKLAGTVDLTIRGTVADPTILGKIQITDGSATFAGTKYQLQRGDIYFTNPVRIDPTIDLDATARVENYDVTVGLHGTSTNFKPTYRSEPPLSEADIFALLALGRTQEESQIYQEQQVAAGTDPTTNALLSGALNATVSNRVSKLFGVGSVKIDPSYVGTLGNSSARITVQQQLSRQLTLTYATNVNSSAQQLIQVQYDLTPTMSIVAARDETGVFSLVYKIRHSYR
jgi:translocation and assembly module TamB